MKSSVLKDLAKKHFQIYPRDNGYLVYRYGKEQGVYNERDLIKLLRKVTVPASKFRVGGRVTKNIGCPCCDIPKFMVKRLDKEARRRWNKITEEE